MTMSSDSSNDDNIRREHRLLAITWHGLLLARETWVDLRPELEFLGLSGSPPGTRIVGILRFPTFGTDQYLGFSYCLWAVVGESLADISEAEFADQVVTQVHQEAAPEVMNRSTWNGILAFSDYEDAVVLSVAEFWNRMTDGT
jgi:hypothetical protein